jgi:hypothetical protein
MGPMPMRLIFSLTPEDAHCNRSPVVMGAAESPAACPCFPADIYRFWGSTKRVSRAGSPRQFGICCCSTQAKQHCTMGISNLFGPAARHLGERRRGDRCESWCATTRSTGLYGSRASARRSSCAGRIRWRSACGRSRKRTRPWAGGGGSRKDPERAAGAGAWLRWGACVVDRVRVRAGGRPWWPSPRTVPAAGVIMRAPSQPTSLPSRYVEQIRARDRPLLNVLNRRP